MHAVRVVEVGACADAYQTVVRLAVVLLHEVHVVGGYDFDVMLPGYVDYHLVDDFLLLVNVGRRVRLVGLVALYLQIEVVAEEVLEPQRRLLSLVYLSSQYVLRNLASQAG